MCAGAGGQALGFEHAGFEHVGLVEIDPNACNTLVLNRPQWKVLRADVNEFDAKPFKGTDVLAAGLPCPPFSVAGKQLGHNDERNLFPAAIRIIKDVKPRAVVIENVRGILDAVFEDYRKYIQGSIVNLGYWTGWKLLNASDYGVSQLRPRVVFVAIRKELSSGFSWPAPNSIRPRSVGDLLFDLMSANGWEGSELWRQQASEIAPTVVGGSLKHGGPDLGPTRSRRAWASLRVDGIGIAEGPPLPGFAGMPKLTVRMVARVQGFPDDWQFYGRKTAAYRQVGNAFPPPVAQSVALQIKKCLAAANKVVPIAG